MTHAAEVMEPDSQAGTPRREKTRLRICEAARHLFLRQGFQSTTMEGIANEAKLRRSTLYNHFRDKEEILEAIGQDYLGQISGIIRKLPSPAPTRAQIDAWIAEFADFAASEPVPTLLLIHTSMEIDGMALLEEFAGRVMVLYAERLPSFRAALEPGNHLAWARATTALRELSWALCHHVEDGGGPRSQAMLRVSGDLFDLLVNGARAVR